MLKKIQYYWVGKALWGGGALVDLEMRGRGVIYSKLILVPQVILYKISTLNQCLKNTYSKCIPELLKIYFLLHFHVCCFSIDRYE